MSRAYTMQEVVGISSESFADAVRRAVEKVAAGFQADSWFEVIEERGHIKGGRVTEYQVRVRVAVPTSQ
ncbi:MAG: dodecin family protein [Myxococcales bacterium]|jgi:flavin-binding protein dodecin